MSLTLTRVTTQRLAQITDAQIDALNARVQRSDWCADEPYTRDLLAKWIDNGTVAAITDEAGALWAVVIGKDAGDGVAKLVGLGPIDDRSAEAFVAIKTALIARGFIAVVMAPTKPQLRAAALRLAGASAIDGLYIRIDF